MKLGAADFLEKPFADEVFIGAVRAALERGNAGAEIRAERAAVIERLALLSARERDVLQGLVSGHPNKTIAYDLGISPRTVEDFGRTSCPSCRPPACPTSCGWLCWRAASTRTEGDRYRARKNTAVAIDQKAASPRGRYATIEEAPDANGITQASGRSSGSDRRRSRRAWRVEIRAGAGRFSVAVSRGADRTPGGGEASCLRLPRHRFQVAGHG